jgi:drug/metabolite transporter (DMT)-like permease
MKWNWNQVAGYGLIVAASGFFGGSASLGKTLMQSGISTTMLMQIRSVVTTLTLIPLLLVFARGDFKIEKHDFFRFLLLGIPGLALVNGSYYYAVKTLPVALAVFIQFIAPVVIFLYGLLTKRETVNTGKVIALLLCIAGTYLMVQLNEVYGGHLPIAGFVSAVISMFSYAFYIVISHRLGQKYSSWTLLFYGYLIAAVFWCFLQNAVTTADVVTQHKLWVPALLFCLISTLIPFNLFLAGLRRVTPTGASIASTSETVSATLFAFIVLGERLMIGQIAGALLILSAVLLLIYQSHEMPTLEEV